MAQRTTNEFITLLRTNSTAVAAEEAVKAAESAAAAEITKTETIAEKDATTVLKDATEQEKWLTEAIKMTADSYANEAEDVFVKIYTSVGDGTFTSVDTDEYSSLHWKLKSESASALHNIVEDLSPQLGGNLDTNGKTINGVTFTGQAKGIAPIADEDLTRKDFVVAAIDALELDSGIWYPTLSNQFNVENSVPYQGNYIKVGNIVTCSLNLYISPITTGTTKAGISLPIASNIGDFSELSGSGAAYKTGLSDVIPVLVHTDTVNDLAEVAFQAPSVGGRTVRINFSYEIVT